jgi:hypothetical protein
MTALFVDCRLAWRGQRVAVVEPNAGWSRATRPPILEASGKFRLAGCVSWRCACGERVRRLMSLRLFIASIASYGRVQTQSKSCRQTQEPTANASTCSHPSTSRRAGKGQTDGKHSCMPYRPPRTRLWCGASPASIASPNCARARPPTDETEPQSKLPNIPQRV